MFQMQFFYYTIRIVGWQTDSMRRFFAECVLKGIPGLFSGDPRKGRETPGRDSCDEAGGDGVPSSNRVAPPNRAEVSREPRIARSGQNGLDGSDAAGASLTERKGRAPLSHAAGGKVCEGAWWSSLSGRNDAQTHPCRLLRPEIRPMVDPAIHCPCNG
jgi:hypothetical protein